MPTHDSPMACAAATVEPAPSLIRSHERVRSPIIQPVDGTVREAMDSVISINGVPIRLTPERWFHIVENHDEVAGSYDAVLDTVADPELIIPGYRGSLMAIRGYGRRRYLYVIYREVTSDDGFIITAYISPKVNRKKAIWKRP